MKQVKIPAFRKTLRSARAPENSHSGMDFGDKGMNLARKGIDLEGKGIELDRKGMHLDAERKEFKSAISRGNARRRPSKANRQLPPVAAPHNAKILFVSYKMHTF